MLEQTSESLAVHAAGAVIPKIGLGTWQLRGEHCAEIVAAALRAGYVHVDTAQGYANEEFVGEGLCGLGRAARPRLRHHQGAARPHGRGRSSALGGRKPVEAARVRDRSSAAPLAEPGDPAGGHDPRAQRGEAGRAGPAHRAVELHQPAAREGLAPDQGAVRRRADRVPPVSRPDEDARGAAPARHGDHRLLPDRARQGRRRSRDRGDRRGAWPHRRAGDAALACPAARRRRDPQDRAEPSGWRRISPFSTSR